MAELALSAPSRAPSPGLPAPQQVADFLRDFTEDPERAVETLARDVGKTVHPQTATAILLPYLVKASYAQQNLIAGALERIATPEHILDSALALFDQGGDPRILATADQLLANRGAASWPALLTLCLSNLPACRSFAWTVGNLGGVPEESRREALVLLARNPDLDTRLEVVALLDGGALDDPLPVWRILLHDSDDTIAVQASNRVESLDG
jgi:hypothetical protein